MEDMDYYAWEQSKKRFTPAKIIGMIFKIAGYSLVVLTFVLILVRSQLSKIPKDFCEFTWTPAAVEAQQDGELELILQEPYTSFDENGYYNLSNVALCPETGEVQFTVRYNSRSTINDLMKFYSLEDRPTGEVFVYILTDQSGKTYTSYTYSAASRPLYEFRRVIFDGVDLSNVETLYLDVYYGADVSNMGRMNANFVLFDSSHDTKVPDSIKVKEHKLTFNSAPAYHNALGGDK